MEDNRAILGAKRAARMLAALAVAAVACLFCLPTAAYAEDAISQTGQINITFGYSSKNLKGGTVCLYRIGDAHLDAEGEYSFTLIEPLSKMDIDLGDADSEDAAKTLLEAVKKAGIKGETIDISSDGTAVFHDVAAGMYLIEQPTAPKGYERSLPFTASVPEAEDGGYTFVVDAHPKVLGEDNPPSPPTPPGRPPRLPQTGQLNWPVPVLAIAGVLLICAGVAVRGRRKKPANALREDAK